jgi:hypothetical protein
MRTPLPLSNSVSNFDAYDDVRRLLMLTQHPTHQSDLQQQPRDLEIYAAFDAICVFALST